MPNWPNQDAVSMNAFYGDPDANDDFKPDAAWESQNIVKLIPPYALYYPMKIGGVLNKRAKKFPYLRVHKKCKTSLESVLNQIEGKFSQAEIRHYELDLCAGVHVFRLKTSGKTLSIHSWGAAIDLSHLINGWKVKYNEKPEKKMMQKAVVAIFKSEGWTWGGGWNPADAMHFQAADV